MGALTPAIGAITTGLGTIGTVASTVKAFDTSSRNLNQLRARQALQESQNAQNIALQREQLATQSRQNAEERRLALRRAVAKQRANFGASGIRNQTGGSGEAVLLGLTQVTEDELKRRDELDTLRNRALDQGFTQTVNRNVLMATQQAEDDNVRNLYRLAEAL